MEFIPYWCLLPRIPNFQKLKKFFFNKPENGLMTLVLGCFFWLIFTLNSNSNRKCCSIELSYKILLKSARGNEVIMRQDVRGLASWSACSSSLLSGSLLDPLLGPGSSLFQLRGSPELIAYFPSKPTFTAPLSPFLEKTENLHFFQSKEQFSCWTIMKIQHLGKCTISCLGILLL